MPDNKRRRNGATIARHLPLFSGRSPRRRRAFYCVTPRLNFTSGRAIIIFARASLDFCGTWSARRVRAGLISAGVASFHTACTECYRSSVLGSSRPDANPGLAAVRTFVFTSGCVKGTYFTVLYCTRLCMFRAMRGHRRDLIPSLS